MRSSRLKQWLNYLRKAYPEAQSLFARIRAVKEADATVEIVLRELARAETGISANEVDICNTMPFLNLSRGGG